MKKTFATLTACVALMAGLPAHADEARPSEPAAAPAPATTATTTAPQMSFGSWGIDLTQLDPKIAPGDDFFDHVNAKWIAANPIPPEHSRYGAFTMLREKSQKDIQALIDELRAAPPAPGSLDARLVDAYESYLDQKAIDAAGLAPAQPYLDAIGSAKTIKDLASLFGQPGYPSPFSAGVMVDDKQPDRYIVGVGVAGLGLPDRDYYLKTDEKSRDIQARYRDYLTFLLGKAGYPDPAATAAAVYDLEYRFAELAWDRTTERNRDLTYNKVSHSELRKLAGPFPLAPMLQASGLGKVKEFVVWQLPPDADEAKALGLSAEDVARIGGGLPAMFQLLAKTPVDTARAWMAAQFLSGNADVLPSDLDNARFAFYGKLLRGQEEQRPRWKRAIDTVESQLGEALGEAYVARHFPPASKAAMLDLIGNVRKALAASLAENAWMSAPTKAEAQAKLDQFTAKIGYPDKFKQYEGLAIERGKPLENAIAAGKWAWQDDLRKLGGPIDRSEWYMLPQTVNAYYDPSKNEIVFPAAILQPPFFGPDADPAVNYGAIGAVIGHEIGHGFDDQGAKSDGTGLMRDWWTQADLAAFTALGDRLARQYDAFCPLDEGKTCVNGRFTLGENMGDLGGLSLAYRAYRMSLGGKEAPVIDGLTGDQRFFLAWAQVWRSADREDTLRQRLLTDPHSPERYRVNGVVRNMDAWYRAFDVTPGDALFLPPEERVHIW
ncbi:M13 family metallopeptidase [Tsuneonella sp. CC-YZS046]|uniref:M13 family metallopeptidase n=1 Tax=Tsuneonella sp. CC-YZS046 TaxID=3042152 RepID=UPI002D79A2BB|nr:M13 family metallopeptidase [Tsuneonella sp. CC-YZS046]WRO66303.1 M13 family metallopeptidase [Tsuneonella sp. CC-YZS046]